jgi:HlyD family secretion protein
MHNNILQLLRSKPIVLTAVIVVVAMICIGAITINKSSDAGESVEGVPLFTVKQGPLTISVSESGTIKAREQVIIKNELEGRTTVLSLVPEASRVKKGDLLVELDASKLVDERLTQLIAVQTAEASFVRAREDLAVAKNQAQSDREQADIDLKFARMDLTKYMEGEYPSELTEKESRIKYQQQEVENKNNQYEWSRTLAEEKYISPTELKEDELAWKKAELDLKLAEEELQLLQNYEYPRNTADFNSKVKQAEMALERVYRKADADVVQGEAELKSAESKFERQQSILSKLEVQISKAKIYAPADGLVVYASSTRGSWRGNDEPLDEGSEVREREELIHLPTADSVKAEVRVHEANMNKVKIGLPVEVKVDAVPGKMFRGKVARIAVLPDAQIMWMNPDLKVYTTDINIEGNMRGLRTGMSCKAEIIIATYEDVVFIPVQAVVRIGDQPTVYVVRGKRLIPCPVEIGMDNNRMVHIINGLKPGEKVSLTPPLAPAEVKHPAVMKRPSGSDEQGKAPGPQRRGGMNKPGQRPGQKPSQRQRPNKGN